VAFAGAQRLDHAWADVAGQERQHVGAAHLVAEGGGLLGELHIEPPRVDFGALEKRPGVLVRIGRVDARIRSLGRPRLASYRLNASKGEVVKTPPKSQITASTANRDPPVKPVRGEA